MGVVVGLCWQSLLGLIHPYPTPGLLLIVPGSRVPARDPLSCMIEQRRVHKIKVEGGILKRTRRWRHTLQGGANEAGHFMLYYLSYSLQISPNAEAIEGGKRKADMLVP